ncbi:hypothetical protein PFDG_05531 [Plasmodium falciparum Dd2]|uniref:Uncharacterized protein n=1 Tax=Plasmodium falciparum (isolate Dd2) TaxID=57267 RepID=A0A0L7M3Z2_PLAF4|nr:hypothetical protein PFDG_05531 [Plasmodium falciparum Dd2]
MLRKITQIENIVRMSLKYVAS